MKSTKFQDINTFILVGIELLLLGIIYWKYISEKKRRQKLEYHYEDYGYGRMQSWRPYIIPIFISILLIYELMKRLYNYIYF